MNPDHPDNDGDDDDDDDDDDANKIQANHQQLHWKHIIKSINITIITVESKFYRTELITMMIFMMMMTNYLYL
ncbi:hypothetical protein QR98_0070820 [Sarcoptes scabiei]|uniref:Uncharacterized protein n=1 Tax=Sarcoptes scabiei TaxID=52283 RepID=A0A132ADN4_SARSC|nr:hypothetical protein QR98_0070820 [Sarcoptes scabiei]